MFQHDNETINDDETMAKIYSLKDNESEKQSIMNRFVRSIPEKRMTQLQVESTEYLNKVYYDKYESEGE